MPNPNQERPYDYWDRQAEFAIRALEVATVHMRDSVHENQLKLPFNLGRNVVSLTSYRQAHRSTPDDFHSPPEAA